MPRLKILHPNSERTEYEFEVESLSIGREGDNHIILDHERVSRHHVELSQQNDFWYLCDMGSTNGTFFNDQRVDALMLRDGDCFTVGDFRLTFYLLTIEPQTVINPGSDSQAESAQTVVEANKHSKSGPSKSRALEKTLNTHKGRSANGSGNSMPDVAMVEGGIESGPVMLVTRPANDHKRSPRQPLIPVTVLRSSDPVASCLANVARPPQFAQKHKARLSVVMLILTICTAAFIAMRPQFTVIDKVPISSTSLQILASSFQHAPAVIDAAAFLPKPITSSQGPLAKPAMMDFEDKGASPGGASGEHIIYQRLPDQDISGPVVSPDLRHVLYYIRRPATGFRLTDVCLDGKIVRTVNHVACESDLRFSADSSAWLIQARDLDGRQALMLPDRALKFEGVVQTILGSRDFEKIAYVTRSGEEDRLFINGEHVSTYHHISSLRFSDAGDHWAYVAVREPYTNTTEPTPGERVVTDQGNGEIHDRISHLTQSQNGLRTAYVAHSRNGGQTLMLDGRPKDACSGVGSEISQLTFSPDGQRFAYLLKAQNEPHSIHADGLPVVNVNLDTPLLEDNSSLSLSAQDEFSSRILFSGDSQHVAYALSGRSASIYIDGVLIGRYPSLQADCLALSLDGSKFAYVSLHPLREASVAADGTQIQLCAAVLRVNGESMQSVPVLCSRHNFSPCLTLGGFSRLMFSSGTPALAYLLNVYDGDHGLIGKGIHVDGACILANSKPIYSFGWSSNGTLQIVIGGNTLSGSLALIESAFRP